MCGRYSFTTTVTDEHLIAIYHAMEKRYAGAYKTGEIFPGDSAPAVIQRENKIIAVPGVFGLPGFQGNRLLINARSETVAEKPAFAESLRQRRAIIPATGFYEWSHDERRTKYLFTVNAAQVLYLCGMYQVLDGRCRFVILTRAANESMLPVHNRMPVIVGAADVRPYLTDYDAAREMIASSAPTLVREAV